METLDWKLSRQMAGRHVIDVECVQRGLSTFGIRTKYRQEVAGIGGRDNTTEFAACRARRIDRRAMDTTGRTQVTQVNVVAVKREVVKHDCELFPVDSTRKTVRVWARNAIAFGFHIDLGLVDVMAKEERRASYCCGINDSTMQSLRRNHLHDNALLAACDELYGKLTRVAAVGLLGTAIGVTWYLLVGLRAGA